MHEYSRISCIPWIFDCTILYKCAYSIINRKQFIVFFIKRTPKKAKNSKIEHLV